jgi:membrane protease YdiL (CAAX protease family)
MRRAPSGAPHPRGDIPLPLYFALVYLLAWGFWYAAGALAGGAGQFLFLPGTFAPGIVAVALTAWSEGAAGVRKLLQPLLQWEVAGKWYLFALGYMAAVKLAAALLYRAGRGDGPRFGDTPWLLMLGATLFSTLIFAQAGEEVGWRGYALPRLMERFGLGPSSILLGVLWAAWHLPLFFIPDTSTTGPSFPLYLAQVTALSVAFAWLWWRTGRSLLLLMLLHAAVNNTKDIVPSAVEGAAGVWALSTSAMGWTTVGVLWICAVFFLVDMRRVVAPKAQSA